MANLVITTAAAAIKVVFNDYAQAAGIEKGYWSAATITATLSYGGGSVIVHDTGTGQTWPLAYTATAGCFIVDSVDGASPTSNSDLCDKIGALVQ